jgi:ABC-2 type transport system ATP-binding protein
VADDRCSPGEELLVLSIRNLSKTYGGKVHALKDVSLDIPKGMFGLLGPNGAGKSTLMRTIATLQPPDSGSIKFGDIDVLGQPDLLRRQLGYLPQDFGVYPRVSAYGMLDHLAQLKGLTDPGERKRQVTDMLMQTNLLYVSAKSLASYSGGMRQRWGIAQALLGDPKLLIVDEPTAGLDPEERSRFHNLLSEIGENVVVILSTHIVDDVADLCSNMAIMDGGEIIARGAPDDLVKAYEGRIWTKAIDKSELEAYAARFTVLSTRLSAGRREVQVLADAAPDPDFRPGRAKLEHVYFATLAERRAKAGAAAEKTAA